MNKLAKIGAILTSLAYIAMIVFVTLALWLRGQGLSDTVYIVNITADIGGMLTAYVLYICCLADVQKTGLNYRYYLCLLNVVFVGMFTDACAWLLDALPAYRWLIFADNLLYYMCMPIAVFFFWLYMSHSLKLSQQRARHVNLVLFAGLLAAILLCIGNIFGKYYFAVDENGIYHREALYPIHQIYGYAVILVTLFVILRARRRLRRFQICCLLLYIFSPLVVGIGNLLIYGLSITYPVESLILLLMYCSINVAQGKEKEAAERDMKMAGAIQEFVLPRVFPPYPERKEFDIYASMKAAKQVGGDFYDFYLIDPDHLGLVIADVSGKGVPAALFMMITKALLKNELLGGSSPAEALKHVNEMLLEGDDSSGMFVTVWIAVFEISTGKGMAANAGHENPLLSRNGENFEVVEYRHSPAVGLMKEMVFREHEFELHPGDTLFVSTDGVDEAMNVEGEFFGTERLLTAVNRDPGDTPEGLLKGLADAIAAFQGSAEQFDDITMLCLHYNGAVKG